MTSPLTQNLKIIGLWIFFLIYCLFFSFILNLELKITSFRVERILSANSYKRLWHYLKLKTSKLCICVSSYLLFIWCSTFSFILNVWLKITLEFLTIINLLVLSYITWASSLTLKLCVFIIEKIVSTSLAQVIS